MYVVELVMPLCTRRPDPIMMSCADATYEPTNGLPQPLHQEHGDLGYLAPIRDTCVKNCSLFNRKVVVNGVMMLVVAHTMATTCPEVPMLVQSTTSQSHAINNNSGSLICHGTDSKFNGTQRVIVLHGIKCNICHLYLLDQVKPLGPNAKLEVDDRLTVLQVDMVNKCRALL